MNRKKLLETIKKMGEAIAASTGSEKFVVLVACEDGEDWVHTYEIGETLSPEEFCRMTVELVVGAYGTNMGWEPPEELRPPL